MKISVITVCWNCVNQIRETIRSVIEQDYIDLEYIIIDGNSTDGTKNIVEEYHSEISKYISEPDLGIYDAMNKGISLASGKWTLFLNAGDLFYNNKVISNIFNNIEFPDNCNVIFGSTIMKYSFGSYIVTPGNPEMLTRRMPFCHQSVFFRTSILKKEPYNLNFRISADHELLLRIFNSYPKSFVRYTGLIAIFDASDGVSSKQIMKMYSESMTATSKISPLTYAKLLIRAYSPKWLKNPLCRFYFHFNKRFKRIK